MLVDLDHVVLATPDPDAAAAALERELGLEASGGGRHPGLGTFNRLVWLGDRYLELIGVEDRSVAEGSWMGPAVLAALDRGGGLATWAIASDALEADAARFRATGADLGAIDTGERVRPDGRVVRWRMACPARLGPLESPFVLEHDTTAAEWTAAERAERARHVHPIGAPVRLAVLELPVAPAALNGTSQRLLRAADLRFRPSLAGGGARDASLGELTIRLAPAADPGAPATVHLRTTSPMADRELELDGVRYRLRGTAASTSGPGP